MLEKARNYNANLCAVVRMLDELEITSDTDGVVVYNSILDLFGSGDLLEVAIEDFIEYYQHDKEFYLSNDDSELTERGIELKRKYEKLEEV